MATATYVFPEDFTWGTATAAHQVEGGNHNNDWWEWEQRGGGRVYQDQSSGPACEWWEGRAEEDIRRMADLHTRAHRLSVEWSRIEPREGSLNHDALDRYRAILGAMRDHGIRPMVTLHHFTNPLWFAARGGWLHPDSPRWFAAFVKKTVPALSDLVDTWCTINEPNVYASQGYFSGIWPPGQQSISAYYRVLKNMVLAHAAAYHVVHDYQPDGRVGFAKHLVVWKPWQESNPLDGLITRLLDRAFNASTLDALHTGDWRPVVGRREQLDVVNTLDWVGINYYTRNHARFEVKNLSALGIDYGVPPGLPKGPPGWGELYPEGLFESIKRVYRQFGLPMHVTENGLPDENDALRPAWILESLRQVWKAVNFNWPVEGYYFWSLLDNFEWAEGYDPRYRFGLYSVNFETQERTLRDSGRLYAEIAAANAISTELVRQYAPSVLSRLFPGNGPEDLRAVVVE